MAHLSLIERRPALLEHRVAATRGRAQRLVVDDAAGTVGRTIVDAITGGDETLAGMLGRCRLRVADADGVRLDDLVGQATAALRRHSPASEIVRRGTVGELGAIAARQPVGDA